MPPPSGPNIAALCYDGDAKGVEDAIAAGEDVLEIVSSPVLFDDGDYLAWKPGPPDPKRGIALHEACNYAHVDCVRALLATECYEQLDWRTAKYGMTPLIRLCKRACDTPITGVPQNNPHRIADTLPCVELLLEAGAALEPKTTEVVTSLVAPIAPDQPPLRRFPSGLTALDFAYLSGRSDIVRALEEAASLRYSVQTHRRFLRPARYVAAHSLRLGYQIGSGALLPVWAARVLPFLISRTSRRAPEAAEAPDAPPPRKRQKVKVIRGPVGDGWWEKKDPTSGRCYYVHESTGACQWEKPVAREAAREGPRQSYADQPMRLKPPSCSGISPGTPKKPRVVLPIHLRPS